MAAGRGQIGIFQSARRSGNLILAAFAHDAAFVNDGDFAAETLDLFQIMRSQQNGLSVPVDLGQVAPQSPAQFHVHAGGGLVEDQKLGVVDQGARQHHPALEAAGQLAQLLLDVRAQFKPLHQFVHPLLADRGRNAEIAAHPVHDLARRGERIDIEFLRAQADHAARFAIILHRVDAENLDLAAGGLGNAGDAMDGGGLARAIGAQKTEKLALGDFQRQVVHGDGAAAIDLAQMRDGEGWSHVRG